ncbi:MAG TPA: PQQ-binding-like beta-propeller repeat protein [Anaerolineae bacterium]|nr:PQQ-binding-like beta-propeller repeat protein [Anaerolineae bacterium]
MKDLNRFIIILSVLLMMIIMGTAVFVTVTGMARTERVTRQDVWMVGANNSNSMNVTDVTGDGVRDIFVQDAEGFYILNGNGEVMSSQSFEQVLATTQGDVDGDGLPDVIAYTGRGDAAMVTVYSGRNELIWSQELEQLGMPGRALALDFENDGRHEVVLGDLDNGRLLALSSDGAILWRYQLAGSGSLRGLDEIQLADGDLVTAGLDSGEVVVLDRQGRLLWSGVAGGGLRRLRSFPLGSGIDGRLMVGSVGGLLEVYQFDDGQTLAWSAQVGQAVNEVRPAEVDGDPATTEVLIGGKDGGLWAYSQAGELLWSTVVGGKLTELLSLQLPQFAEPLVVVGTDEGTVAIYDRAGILLHRFGMPSGINRLESGNFGESQGFLVADANQVVYFSLGTEAAPFWYTPLLAGVLACLFVAAIAFYLSSRLVPTPTLYVSAQDNSVSAQLARRRMLHESIGDLKEMQREGALSGQAYLSRMRRLREQLMGVNQSLIDAGESVAMETFVCPHCNGPLELGTDKCEYCGQVTIV